MLHSHTDGAAFQEELKRFATSAKKAGVSVVQLVGVQKRQQCPGPWYGGEIDRHEELLSLSRSSADPQCIATGLQLCDHINGSCKCRGRYVCVFFKVRSLSAAATQILPWTALSWSGKRW